jgi:hypothetical protein
VRQAGHGLLQRAGLKYLDRVEESAVSSARASPSSSLRYTPRPRQQSCGPFPQLHRRLTHPLAEARRHRGDRVGALEVPLAVDNTRGANLDLNLVDAELQEAGRVLRRMAVEDALEALDHRLNVSLTLVEDVKEDAGGDGAILCTEGSVS